MALSDLKTYSAVEYRALTITPFDLTPERSSSGTPTANATIALAGWVDKDKIAFTLDNGENILVNETLDQVNDCVAVEAIGFSPAQSKTTYCTVNLGEDAISKDWSLSFAMSSSSKSGKWTYTKGKIKNDGPQTHIFNP